MPDTAPQLPPPTVGAGVQSLRADLTAAGYTVGGVTARLGDVAARALARDRATPARRLLANATDPVAVLIRLFVLGDPVPAAAVGTALPNLGVTGAVDLGIVRRHGGTGDTGDTGDQDGKTRDGDDPVRGLVDLQPHAVEDAAGTSEWWVVSDLGEVAHGGTQLPTEHVLGVGAASMTLVDIVVPPVAGQRCLDVGTGSGVQSLHLLRTGGQVVATDLSQRACAFAKFTAALNDVEVDVRAGSLLDPVAGESFDRIVANLPFVVTPRGADVPRYTYRDAGLAGDDVVRRMLLQAPLHLTPGGLAQFLGNWEDRADEGWRERLTGWVTEAAQEVYRASEGRDVIDVWVVQRELADPALYAETWIGDGGLPGAATSEAWYRAWLDDFEARGVEAVGFGSVTVRRRPADPATPPLRRFDEEHGAVPGAWRDILAAGLSGHDALAAIGAHDDLGRLREARPLVAAGVLERRELVPGAVDLTHVYLVDSVRRGLVVEASTALAGLFGACDGQLSVGQILGALADLLHTEEDELSATVLPAVRELVAEGLLVLP